MFKRLVPLVAIATASLSVALYPLTADETPGQPATESAITKSDAAKSDAAKSDGGNADEPDPAEAAKAKAAAVQAEIARIGKELERGGMKRLAPDADVWLDGKKKRITMLGTVCLTKGQLEMFACPTNTKEHESIVSVRTRAYYIHAALLALGAKPGGAAKFEPHYVPASGTEVAVDCYWTDEKGKPQSSPAQQWVRHLATGQAMTFPWVFAGSGFWKDETTGQRHYLADGGDFICVSNFASALLDVPVRSSQENDNLAFEALTENIPPRGTLVRLVLTPKLPKVAQKKGK